MRSLLFSSLSSPGPAFPSKCLLDPSKSFRFVPILSSFQGSLSSSLPFSTSSLLSVSTTPAHSLLKKYASKAKFAWHSFTGFSPLFIFESPLPSASSKFTVIFCGRASFSVNFFTSSWPGASFRVCVASRALGTTACVCRSWLSSTNHPQSLASFLFSSFNSSKSMTFWQTATSLIFLQWKGVFLVCFKSASAVWTSA